ncbi:MAG TPA: hypothetical protein VNK91_01935 [Burkholderiaceae bacterium]|nr:hypothetical protein [Burkholderiaceae bacterium]
MGSKRKGGGRRRRYGTWTSKTDMDLKNMQLSKAESETMLSPSKPSDGPRYPYGLQLHLTTEVLDKLALAGLPEVGATVMVHARATVVSVSQREEQDGDKQKTCELQITDLALAPEPKDGDLARALYGA